MAQEQVTVWARPERGTRGPAAVHSRAELAAAAVALADRDGLAAASMRGVARALGTGQASLYRYISGRDDLLDLMTDAVAGEVRLDIPLSGDPVEDLVALASRTKAVHLRHPWLSDIPPEPLRLGPRGLDHLEYALSALASAPLPGRVKMEIIGLMNALVAQFARTELQESRGRPGRREAQTAYLSGAAARGAHPRIAAALAHGAGAGPAQLPAELFEGMMRRVLDGLLASGPS
ncbi:TetR/AcrR family transcriptional regulator [Streptomyces sp. MNU89]|uniref:TetR/AcrR family transcriptional regulator n=1 Tax=Streptomyces sp. MNU89 TaxID=2560025 RepID=UPI001E4AA904|nr:TetR family transcriptional regulator [Streptomyces sp. MNU89]MCC9742498.1 TetR/AcrR family transcriptional regulator [Streptomyces sp. MNU89]